MPQPLAPIQAPPPRPPRYGLLAVAPVVDDGDLRPLSAGWNFQPEGCGISGIGDADCAGNTDLMDPPAQPDSVDGDPLWIWGADECSTFGFNAREWEGRARRQLQSTESYQLANELWDGTVTQAAGLGNRWLAAADALSDTVTNGPSAVATALACVEQGLAETLYGQQGMIHTTPGVLQHLATRAHVAKEGNVWVTPMGHVVVADAGYSGSGPDGTPASTSQWIYGTSFIQVRLGPVEIIPGGLDDARNLAAAMDRQLNDIVVYAGRLAGFQWQTECSHIAAEVDIPVCLIEGAS